MMVFASSMFVAGFAFSFVRGWYLSLLLLVGYPVLGFASFLMASALTKGFIEYTKAYQKSAGFSEQAISAMKVVHSYGQEKLEILNYTKYLVIAKNVGIRTNMNQAIGIASVFSVIFWFYAYSFYVGSVLILSPTIKNKGVQYTGGDVVSCLFGILLGAFYIAGALPNLKAIIEARIAGYNIYSTIDRNPEIIID